MKKNSLKSLVVIFAFSTLSAAEGPSLEQLQEQLIDAARAGDAEAVDHLLKVEGINVNEKNKDGNTALHLALDNGHTKIVKLLLAVEGINVNNADMFDWTALHIATYEGYTEVVKLLLASKEINVNQKNKIGDTALHIAGRWDQTEIVKLLLAHGKNASATSDEQKCPTKTE